MLFAEEYSSGIRERQRLVVGQRKLKTQNEKGDTDAADCSCEYCLGKVRDL